MTWGGAVGVLYLGLAASPALATPLEKPVTEQPVAAEPVATEPVATEPAEAAFASGQWQLAAALYDAMPVTERTASQQLNLARARGHLGLWLEALDDYEALLAPQSPRPAPSGWQGLRSTAEAEGADLGRNLPWAQLDFAIEPPRGSSVFIDGHWISPGRFEEAYPVNPGWHTFLLEVDGQVKAARRMYFEKGQKRTVHLASGGLAEPAKGSLSTPANLLPESLPVSAPRPLDADSSGATPLRKTAYVSMAVSAVGAVAWTALAAYTLRTKSQLDASCDDDNICTDGKAYDKFHRALRHTNTAGTVTAVAAATAGALWFLSSHQENSDSNGQQASLTPYVGLGSAGVIGQF